MIPKNFENTFSKFFFLLWLLGTCRALCTASRLGEATLALYALAVDVSLVASIAPHVLSSDTSVAHLTLGCCTIRFETDLAAVAPAVFGLRVRTTLALLGWLCRLTRYKMERNCCEHSNDKHRTHFFPSSKIFFRMVTVTVTKTNGQ